MHIQYISSGDTNTSNIETCIKFPGIFNVRRSIAKKNTLSKPSSGLIHLSTPPSNPDSSTLSNMLFKNSISDLENLPLEFLSLDFPLIHKAIMYAKKHHGTQQRQTGEPYYRHPMSVADIAINYFCETNVILCSILHDTLEDTKLTREEIKKEFNITTLNCTILLTNQKGENLEQRINHIIDNTHKLKPPRTNRTLLIKLADRLHNMQSLHVKSKEKQQRIAAETMDILLPIAKNLQLIDIHKQLQVLCEKYK